MARIKKEKEVAASDYDGAFEQAAAMIEAGEMDTEASVLYDEGEGEVLESIANFEPEVVPTPEKISIVLPAFYGKKLCVSINGVETCYATGKEQEIPYNHYLVLRDAYDL